MIVLGLGSSIEPRLDYLNQAIEELRNNGVDILKQSKIYKTAAWGGVAKNEFLNMCIAVNYANNANELLDLIQKIEKKLGRIRKNHWEDRPIDIDILLFNNQIINNSILTIPHPYITKRNFVLCPMIDILGDIEFEHYKLSHYLSKINEEIEIFNIER